MKAAEVQEAERKAGKPLEKFTYADLVRLERPDPPSNSRPAPASVSTVASDTSVPSVTRPVTRVVTRAKPVTSDKPSDTSVPSVTSVTRRSDRNARWRSTRRLSQMNVSLPTELVEALREKARRTGVKLAEYIEQLVYADVCDLVESLDVTSDTSDVSMMMTDDVVRAVREASNIIDHQYTEFLGKPMPERDQTAIAEFVQQHGAPDEAAVQIGFATTLLRTKETNISSVRYFFNEIRNAMGMPSDSRKTMAAARVYRWRREGKG